MEWHKRIFNHKDEWLLLILVIFFIVIWKLPPLDILQGLVFMTLPTHAITEIFSIIVSMMVFALIFSARHIVKNSKAVFLASAFFIVSLVDVAHTLSYAGMPAFVTPGSPTKSIFFWLIARYIAGLSLLTVAILHWRNTELKLNFNYMVLASITLVGLAYYLGLYHLDAMPRTFIPGQGLTSFKIGAEYTLIAMLGTTAFMFYRKINRNQEFDTRYLFFATAITILSELSFTLYSDITDMFNLLGHIYKVIAYVYIFRAMFIFAVRKPYEKLSQSEQYNRSLFENSTIGLALTDMEGRLIDVNQSFADIIGCSIDECKEKSYWQITPEIYAKQEQQQIEKLLTNGLYGPYEKEYVHKDGHLVPVRLSGSLIKRDGRQFIWSSVEDITHEVKANRARYETEQHFRQLAEHIREVFWISNVDKTEFIYISPAYRSIWGRTCESLYADPATFEQAIHPVDYQKMKSALASQAYSHYSQEYRIIRPDGSVRWIKTQSFPVRNHEGVIYRIAGISEDFTEEKEAQALLEKRVKERTQDLAKKEKQLIDARDEAQRANLAKSQFLSRMSHELRTPLNAIIGFSHLLILSEDLDDNQLSSVKDILSAGEHLLEMVNEVLDLARIESSNYTLDIVDTNIVETIQECVTLSEPIFQQYEVKVSINTEVTGDGIVKSDHTKLRQIILNLLSNASKYNQRGGSITIRCSDRDNHMVRVEVVDTGIGIPEDKYDYVFEPFNRLDAKNSEIEGTGIGLTITRQLVMAMNGNIGFNSTPGQGTIFWFELPAAQ